MTVKELNEGYVGINFTDISKEEGLAFPDY